MVAFFSPALPYVVPTTMIDVIKHLGLTSGLKLCLDAGDISSYDGTSQTWADVSGNSYSFYRGSGSGSDAADPTFNGTAGRQSSSEFFSFDGGDYFTLNQANPTWVDNLHKDNAKVSAVCWLYLGSISASDVNPIFGTSVRSSIIGSGLFINSLGLLAWNATNGSANAYFNGSADAFTAGAWSFAGLSLDEAGNTATFVVNGAATSRGGTYSSPTASNAANVLVVGKLDGVPDDFLESGSRMAGLSVWEGTALTATQLEAIYNATKAKFGH